MVLRSDESANQAEVEREQRFRGNVGKGLGAAASLATAAIGGPLAARAAGSLAPKIMPFLNKYIPAGLAMKGIKKVSPKLGAFLEKGNEIGLNVEEGLGFLKEKLGGNEPQKPKQEKNIIEQESPELHSFIEQLIRQGRKPLEAAGLATLDTSNGQRFKKIIDKLQKQHKIGWGKIVESIYGLGDKGLPSNEQQQQPMQQQQASQPGQQQPGQGLDPAVAQILQQGQAILSKFKGQMQ